MYAYIENNKFIRWVDLKKDYPNISFPSVITSSNLPDGVVMVEMNNPPLIPNIDENIIRKDEPILVNNTWKLDYEFQKKSPEEFQIIIQEVSNQVRQTRNELLSETDWTQLSDSPVDKEVWAIYRQSLRDISTQEGFPFNILWPIKP